MPQTGTNRLADRLRKQIRSTGPISISDYWVQCLFDPKYGYYTTREPFGTDGDFTTAPEISQMFGEMLAVWWLETVQQNELKNIALVEIGPGRGTLMADMLRTIAKLDPNAAQKFDVHMVETSDRLTLKQQEKLKFFDFSITWHKTIETLPHISLGIIANELFDAIPIRQFVYTAHGWQECCVGLNDQQEFGFVIGSAKLETDVLPKEHKDQPIGAIFEHAPAREAMMQIIASHLDQFGGFGLFIDYGHAQSGFGDTIQAMKNHKFINVLEEQGLVDITSHVDFAALANLAKNHTLRVYQPVEQGAFLLRLGLKTRLERLVLLRPDHRENFVTAFERLTENAQMGSLFKVLGVCHPSITLPAL
jgi:SAM-dependent MidA family methyltransferase